MQKTSRSKGRSQIQRPQQTRVQRSEPKQLLDSLHSTFRDIWFYVAALMLIVNACYAYRPQLQVECSTSTDGQPAGTLFTIVNNGAWTLFEIKMRCSIYHGLRKVLTAEEVTSQFGPDGAVNGSQEITSLPPSISATRDCGLGENGAIKMTFSDPAAVAIDVRLSYRWMLGWLTSTKQVSFDTRRIGSRFILVPDVE